MDTTSHSYKTITTLNNSNEGNINLTSISGIPTSVTSIGDNAFRFCSSLSSITIPTSVTSIRNDAFRSCTSLTSITIPISVTSIDTGVFSLCTSLSSITIPTSVTSILEYAFAACRSLTSITIPTSVTVIRDNAFAECISLSSITIPTSVISIGARVFYECRSLSSVTIPISVRSIGDGAFRSCTSLRSVTIPTSVTSIGASAFYSCTSLSSVTIPTSVRSIGDGAFRSCTSLTSITISTGVTSIDANVFYECTSLSSVTIPSSVISIGAQAFYRCTSLQNVYTDSTEAKVYTDGPHYDDFYSSGQAITVQIIAISNICFLVGTPITTNQGIVPIENINPKIHTIRNKPIQYITKTVTQDKYLVCFEKDALGKNIPSQKTIISKNHMIFYKGQMIQAKQFVCNFESVYKIPYNREVLYNVLMEDHNKMIVNNLICETLHPENGIARLYRHVEMLTPCEKYSFIEGYNKHCRENNIFAPKNKKVIKNNLMHK